jgi:tetratricopeptide (TPR) repeat protein
VLLVAKRKVKGIIYPVFSASHTYRGTSGSTTFLLENFLFSFFYFLLLFFECLFSLAASSSEERNASYPPSVKVLRSGTTVRHYGQALRSVTALAGSLAGTHALVLRASACYEAGNYPAALEDAQEALAALQSQSQQRLVNVSWEGQAWRVSADAHQALGNIAAAVEALQEWAVHTPSFRTKALKEIQRLQS